MSAKLLLLTPQMPAGASQMSAKFSLSSASKSGQMMPMLFSPVKAARTLGLTLGLLLGTASALEIKVQQGDTLGAIAKRHNTTVEAIIKANNLTGSKLSLGQVLRIPTPATVTIQAGDTLGGIARRYGVDIATLRRINGLSNDRLAQGQVLRLVGPNAPTQRAPQATTTPNRDATRIKVEDGDTLGAIAKRHNTTPEALRAANNLSSDRLAIGQELRLPSAQTPTKAPVASSTPSVRAGKLRHTVAGGDTLSEIAKTYGTSVEKIEALNDVSSNNLKLGRVLVLPLEATLPKPVAPRVAAPKPTTPQPVAQPTTKPKINRDGSFVVRPGDTLAGLAKLLGVTPQALSSANRLNGKTPQVGQVLRLPAQATPKAPVAQKPVAPAPTPVATKAKPAAKPVVAVPAPSAPASKPAPNLAQTLAPVNAPSAATPSAVVKAPQEPVGNLANTPAAQTRAPQAVAAKPEPIPNVTTVNPGTTKPAPNDTATQGGVDNVDASSLVETPDKAENDTNNQFAQTPTTTDATAQNSGTQSTDVQAPNAQQTPETPPSGEDSPTGATETYTPDEPGANAPLSPGTVIPGAGVPKPPAGYGARKERVLWPTRGQITSYFGWRRLRVGRSRFHTGLDIATSRGTPVYAATSGRVIHSGWSRIGYGYLVIIRGLDGRQYYYAHNSRLRVYRGQYVLQGSLISNVGSTGWSTGPHCHFEVRVGGRARNPLAYLPRSMASQASYVRR